MRHLERAVAEKNTFSGRISCDIPSPMLFSPTYPTIIAAEGTHDPRQGLGRESEVGRCRGHCVGLLLYSSTNCRNFILQYESSNCLVRSGNGQCIMLLRCTSRVPMVGMAETTIDTAQAVGCPPQPVSAVRKFRHPLLVSPTVLYVSPYVRTLSMLAGVYSCFNKACEGLCEYRSVPVWCRVRERFSISIYSSTTSCICIMSCSEK